MILIVGLGNPGKKFEKTRHNVGFRVVNEFAKKNNFPDFKISKKFNALISEGEFNNEKVILAKSQTFMNLSGKAVKKLVSSFRFQVYGLFTTTLICLWEKLELSKIGAQPATKEWSQ